MRGLRAVHTHNDFPRALSDGEESDGSITFAPFADAAGFRGYRLSRDRYVGDDARTSQKNGCAQKEPAARNEAGVFLQRKLHATQCIRYEREVRICADA